MKLSVDRIEGPFAVCIDDCGGRLDIPLADLPAQVREGSVIQEKDGEFVICPEEEASKRKKNFKRASSLFDE